MILRGFHTTALLALGLLVAPVALSAQTEKECEFVGSRGASAASEALQKITEESTPEETQAAYSEALEALEDELDDDNAVVLLLATQANLGLGRFDEAQTLLEKFDAMAPECAEHSHTLRYNGWVQLYNAGIEAYSAGDTETALQRFRQANEFLPDLRSYNNAALLYSEIGDVENAVATYREALSLETADADPEQMQSAMKGLGDVLISEGRIDEALEAYASYLEQHPDDVVIRIRYALAASEAGRADEAAQIYEEVLSRDDLTAEQWVEVGVGLYNAEDYASAATAFEKARQVNPFNKEAMENLVNASVLAGRPGPVLALADTLVTWYPYDQTNYQLLARAFADADMNDRAMDAINRSEATDVVFHFVQMAPTRSGQYIVRGSFGGRGATGQITIPFEFLDASGQVVATDTVTIEVPAEGETGTFQLTVDPGVPLAGFRYQRHAS